MTSAVANNTNTRKKYFYNVIINIGETRTQFCIQNVIIMILQVTRLTLNKMV